MPFVNRAIAKNHIFIIKYSKTRDKVCDIIKLRVYITRDIICFYACVCKACERDVPRRNHRKNSAPRGFLAFPRKKKTLTEKASRISAVKK